MPLNTGQQAAKDLIFDFIDDPDARVFNFVGPAGTGKTYTLGDISHTIEGQAELCHALGVHKDYTNIEFTATTNKAAKVITEATKIDTGTIYSRLGIKLVNDFQTGDKKLNFSTSKFEEGKLIIVVDESSYLDERMFKAILKLMPNCKLIFTQDPYQLQSVKGSIPPIEEYAGQWTAELTQVQRSSGKLAELTMYLRECVRLQEDPNFDADNKQIFLIDDDRFMDRIDSLFGSDWQPNTARILTYTNKQAQAYNQYLRDFRKQESVFCSGDFVIVNEFCRGFSTDAELLLTNEADSIRRHMGLEYKYFAMGEKGLAVPLNYTKFHAMVEEARKAKDWYKYFALKEFFIDLRDPYAMTTHKAQGSTYEHSLVDFTDFTSCRNWDTKRRLAYVGVSRASQQFIGCL